MRLCRRVLHRIHINTPDAISVDRTAAPARVPTIAMSSPDLDHGGRNKSTYIRISSRTAVPRVEATTSDAFKLTVPQSLACGAIGRGVQIASFFPVDTIKTRVQAAHSATVSSSSLPSSAGSIASLKNAVRQGRFYSGVGVNLLGQVPYGMLTFGLYETLSSHFSENHVNLPEWARIMLAAGIGDAIGSLWLTPSEVIKSKTQTGLFKTPMAAIRAIAANGPLSFYQGYAAALARDVPFRAMQLFLYERCRTSYITHFASSRTGNITPVENLLIGAFSGSITAVATNPLDVIRTRMMAQPVGKLATYPNVFDCVAKTFSTEGLPAFLRGVGPRIFLLGPASAVFFLTYETAKGFFRSRPAKPKHAVAHQPIQCCHRRPVFKC